MTLRSRGAKWAAGTVFVAALMTGAGLAWRNFQALAAAREAVAAEERAEAALRREAMAARAALTKSSARVSELAAALKKIEEQRGASKPVADGATGGGGAKPRSLNVAHVIRNEPETQTWFVEKQRGEMRVFYGPLFRQLDWPREKQEAFVANVLARNEKWMDLDNLAKDGGDAEAIAKLKAEASKAHDTAQRALLGEKGARRWQEYERTAGIRNMVSTIAGVAVVEGVPITATQADEVVRLIAEASEGYRAGGPAMMESVDWATAEARLRKVLSPAQLDVLRTMDPGPTTGGLAQSLLYAEVARANAREKSDAAGAAKPQGGR